MNQIELKTPRLLLKSITPSIIHQLFDEKSEAEIRRFFNTDEEGYLRLESMHQNGMETHRISLFYFLIVDKETQRIIGECGFHTWDKTHRRAELFYNLRKDSDKGKGLMTEALPEVMKYGFNTLNIHRIEALVAKWNTASVKLLERFKFTHEGTMREDYIVSGNHENSECYSLLKHEWENYKRNGQ